MFDVFFFTFAPLLLSATTATRPNAGYESITKPSWTPPPYVFPIVWTILYVSMGYASYRVYTLGGASSPALVVYGIQLLLNIAWTPLFFGLRRYRDALFLLRLLLLMVIVTCILFWQEDPLSGALILPYIAWLLVAHELNRSIVNLNPDL